MIEVVLALTVCVSTPECAVRELRPWAERVKCEQTTRRRHRCEVAQANGHVFRYQVERRFDANLGAEYVGGYLVAWPCRAHGGWGAARVEAISFALRGVG